MYIIMKDKEIIAAHDDEDIAREYLRSQNDSEMSLLRLKKRKSRELENAPSFLDVYLVRYGNFYVPYSQYVAIRDLTSQRDDDLRYCRDILFRLLEEDVISEKDIFAVKKTLSIVINQIESMDDNEYAALEKLRTQLDEMKP